MKSGHGCIACASNRFWDTKSPFYKPLPKVPGFGVDVTAEEIGWTSTGVVAAVIAAEAVGGAIRSKIRPKEPGDAPPPAERRS